MSWPMFGGVSSVWEEIQEEGLTLGGWRLGDGGRGREGSSAKSKLRLREAKQITQIKQLVPDFFVTQCRNGQRSIINQKDICIGSSLYLLSTLATDKPWLGYEPADIGAELMGPHNPDPGVTCKAGATGHHVSYPNLHIPKPRPPHMQLTTSGQPTDQLTHQQPSSHTQRLCCLITQRSSRCLTLKDLPYFSPPLTPHPPTVWTQVFWLVIKLFHLALSLQLHKLFSFYFHHLNNTFNPLLPPRPRGRWQKGSSSLWP